MKALKNIFLINAIIEITGGVVVMINPALLLDIPNTDNMVLNISKALGIAAFTMGVVSYQLYRHELLNIRGSKMIALIFMLYHVLMTFTFYSMYNTDIIPHIGATGLHLVVSIIFAILYFQTVGIELKSKK
ncbi:hypothetical protein N9602_04000 [Saprospiraceae bacterium]|nr:hypothetical protein [Saprospiraceae bacterium]MDC1309056.1 hypothetical protein [Saprospiraceae bacterium]